MSDLLKLRALVKRTCHTPLLVAGQFVAVYDTDLGGPNRRSTIATEDELLLALEHTIRELQVANTHLRTRVR